MIEYQGYTGVFEFDAELALFAGHVVDLRDELYFEGESVEELSESMRRAVDQYLEVCKIRGEKPEKPFSGRFNVRVGPTTHRQIAAAAAAAGLSMNEWISGLLESGLSAIDRAAEVLVLDDSRKTKSKGASSTKSKSPAPRRKVPKPRAAKAAAAKAPAKAASATARARKAKTSASRKPATKAR